MKIFKLSTAEGYAWLTTIDDCSIDELQTYDGRSHKKEEWQERKVEPIKVERKKRKLEDCSELFNIPVFSKNAVEKLYELIKEDVEILPLDCKAGEYSLINVTTVLEAVDRSKSDFHLFKGTDEIMYFRKYAFYEDVVEGHDIFKTTEERLSPVFVSERFVQAVEENKLTAFDFELVWDSEEDKK